ncbi:ferredoxin [Candidatus Falkowbacteria bacterium]|nr:ferredoxin [Candidatus Falkowbacteria bacterium]
MAVSVNKDKCIGCAACTQVCSQSFQMAQDGKAEVVAESECAPNAAAACPAKAITVE